MDKGEIMEDFKWFATKRVVIGLLIAVAILWLMGTVVGLFLKPEIPVTVALPKPSAVQIPSFHQTDSEHPSEGESPGSESEHKAAPSAPAPNHQAQSETHTNSSQSAHSSPSGVEKPATPSDTKDASEALHPAKKPGVEFISALVKPLSYELDGRFWGWRPNDILNFTDNVNNFQLGVLEVTRRAVVILTERLSRTGSVETLDKSLEHAMDWLMTNPERYWFPSPESRYEDALSELNVYKSKLEKGEANFYTRADNLLPLLATFENLLGSCDENLVKDHEPNGEPVSWFKTDDYFYYAQGVASAMETILEAVQEDFRPTIENRHGTEILHHAIAACHRAVGIHPWIVTDSDYGGILANHRANMAAPISHARFYLAVLISALSI